MNSTKSLLNFKKTFSLDIVVIWFQRISFLASRCFFQVHDEMEHLAAIEHLGSLGSGSDKPWRLTMATLWKIVI